MISHSHQWKPTYIGKHCEAIANRAPAKKTQYLKCHECGQIGFKYLNRSIIYTWEKTK